MNERTDPRRIWRQNWLNCLREFADADLQRRKWLDPDNRNPHWSYVEFMCSYFDDALHSHDYKWAIGQGMVTADEVSAVTSLHQLLDRHKAPEGNDYDNSRILADPAWHEVVEEAARTRKSLLTLLADPDERNILLPID